MYIDLPQQEKFSVKQCLRFGTVLLFNSILWSSPSLILFFYYNICSLI